MKKSDIFWQTYLNLEKQTLEVSRFIFFTDEVIEHADGEVRTHTSETQLKTFSPHIADLLINCCVQIEAISKELYFENGGTKKRGDRRLYFDDVCLTHIDNKWKTSNKAVIITAPSFNFTKDENKILKPLEQAHLRKEHWEIAYQALKHDRYGSLSQGSVKNLLHALAALYLLNVYYRNPSWQLKYLDIFNTDFSLGSNIFCVAFPCVHHLMDDRVPIKGESPFIVKYRDEDEKHIAEMRQRENEAAERWWCAQPELREEAFIKRLQSLQETTHIQSKFVELGEYRMEKLIPPELPYEEKRTRLLNSQAWKEISKGSISSETEDKITVHNIQKKIKIAAIWEGTSPFRQSISYEICRFSGHDAICEICIE